jgi:hypothetical protein
MKAAELPKNPTPAWIRSVDFDASFVPLSVSSLLVNPTAQKSNFPGFAIPLISLRSFKVVVPLQQTRGCKLS